MSSRKKVSEKTVTPGPSWALLSLLALALASRTLSLSRSHLFPVYDEVAYLDQARDMAQRGVTGTIACHLRGECREDNRHPLYAAMLAPLMGAGPKDFARGKLLTLACSIGLIALVYFSCRRRWGEETGLACAALLALSWMTAHTSHQILADVLFTGIYFAALMSLVLGRSWAVFGLLAGLAYLAKGSGHLLLLAPLALAARRLRRRQPTLGALAQAVGGFTATASLLLWRNGIVWGDVFHNFNAKVIFLDRWGDMWRLVGTPQWEEIGPAWYWRRHGTVEVLQRLLNGSKAVFINLVQCLGSGPMWPPSHLAVGAALLILAAYGVARRWREGQREEILILLSPTILYLPALAWSQQAGISGFRFLLPVAVTLLPMAVLGAGDALRRWASPAFVEKGPGALRAAVFLASTSVLIGSFKGLTLDPRRLWALPAPWAETSAWIGQHVGEEGFLISPDSLFSTWDCCRDRRRPYPFDVAEAELKAFIQRRHIRHALADKAIIAADPQTGKYGPADASGPTSFLGWPRCFHDSLQPSQSLIYSPDCPSSAGTKQSP